jgi:hypothetical protein
MEADTLTTLRLTVETVAPAAPFAFAAALAVIGTVAALRTGWAAGRRDRRRTRLMLERTEAMLDRTQAMLEVLLGALEAEGYAVRFVRDRTGNATGAAILKAEAALEVGNETPGKPNEAAEIPAGTASLRPAAA